MSILLPREWRNSPEEQIRLLNYREYNLRMEIERLTAELDHERMARQAAESRLAAFDPVTEAQQRSQHDA